MHDKISYVNNLYCVQGALWSLTTHSSSHNPAADNIKCEFRKGKRIVVVGERKNRLFEMKFKDCKNESINPPQINIIHSQSRS